MQVTGRAGEPWLLLTQGEAGPSSSYSEDTTTSGVRARTALLHAILYSSALCYVAV